MNFSFFELCLPDDDPVYTLKKVMEDLDFSGLLANCSDPSLGVSTIIFWSLFCFGTATVNKMLAFFVFQKLDKKLF